MIIQAPENAATYISEKDRFHNRKLDSDFLDQEKEKKNNINFYKIDKLKNLYQKVAEEKNLKEQLTVSKDTQSLIQRTKKLFKYEMVIKIIIFFFR